MAPSGSEQITQLLNDLRQGDRSAESKLIPFVYPELRKIASKYMSRERANHTLQATALVHEVYLRVAGQENQAWENRAHFFGVAALLMRQILVDHARRFKAARRGGGPQRIELQDSLLVCRDNADIVLEVDRAITKLELLDSRQAHIVVCRFFGGLTEDEIATALGISVRTVKRDWTMAKAWLHGKLTKERSPNDA